MWKIKLTCVLVLCLGQHMVGAQFGFMDSIQRSITASFGGFGNAFGGMGNFGSSISNSVRQSLAPLANLGAEINQGVQNALAPVRAMAVKTQMMQGIGGTTIATYEGSNPATFIIRNGVRSICRGILTGPTCRGVLEPFVIRSRGDYCFAPYYAMAGDNICLSGSSINVAAINDNINCRSTSGAPIVYMTQAEYQMTCGGPMPPLAHFTYYANSYDPRAVQIPNDNPYVHCEDSQPGVCSFESEVPGGSGVTMGGSSFMFSG